VAEFTGGDPAIQGGLNAMYADQENWPQPQKQNFAIRQKFTTSSGERQKPGKTKTDGN
jgi:hypothetical protein